MSDQHAEGVRALDYITDSYRDGFLFSQERDGRWIRHTPVPHMTTITVVTWPLVLAELNRRAARNDGDVGA